MPKVSVIIPNYNHAPYLEQRIESVLNQTYQDFEVILMDDCSSDSSVDILKRYENHPKVSHLLLNEQNSGSTFRQWKKGIEHAKGEYIWIAESDDWADRCFLQTLLNAIDANNKIDIAFCSSINVDEIGGQIGSYRSRSTDLIENGSNFLLKCMYFDNYIYNASMSIFRKELFEKIDHELYTQYKYCGDWMFWSQMLTVANFVFESKRQLNFFRKHTASVTSLSIKKGLGMTEGIDVFLFILSRLRLKPSRRFRMLNSWAYQLAFQKVITHEISNITFVHTAKKLIRSHPLSFVLLSRQVLMLYFRKQLLRQSILIHKVVA